jgi:membrane dipeptidase
MIRDFTRRGVIAGGTAMLSAPSLARKRPARRSPVIDGLSFLPDTLEDLATAGLDAMICDVSIVETIKDAQGLPRYLRTFEVNDAALAKAVARIEAASPRVRLGLRGSDIGSGEGCVAFLQFQSCETVGTDLSRIGRFHRGGLRILQFTHHNDNAFAGGAIEPVQSGLTPLGIAGLAEMNRVGLVPDVSHGSEATMLDVARYSKTPFVLSHGACRAIVDNPRCASDAVIRALATRGGVMGIFMMSFWLTRGLVPTPQDYVDQIRHVVRVGGIEAVGIANDFPVGGEAQLLSVGNDNAKGVAFYIDWWRAMHQRGVPGFAEEPRHVVFPEFNRIDRMARIREALDKGGFRSAEIDRIMGGNWKRVLTDVLG